MTKNWNFCRSLDLRNEFIAASWNHKIYNVIKLEQECKFREAGYVYNSQQSKKKKV